MDSFNTPDLNAPRYRPQVYNLLNKKLFRRFRNKHPKYKDLDDKTLRAIIKSFNQKIYETVVEERNGVNLPENIGWLFVGTCINNKKKNIDFAKSKEYGVKVTNKNWDTDGRLAKIFYSSYAPKYKIKNREFWYFVACRDFKRLVAKTYPENWNMYVTIEPTKKIKQQYARQAYKDYINNKTKEQLKDYNEFDL
jgi:hypothetical protein